MNLWSVKHFLNISFIKIRFSCNQNIRETLTQCKQSNFDERNVQEMFNWSEIHSERNNFLKNPYFSETFVQVCLTDQYKRSNCTRTVVNTP